jgi:hypothetical protein
VLAAVTARALERENLLDRLWRSRAWWLGWAGAVALLLAAEVPGSGSTALVDVQRLELERWARIEALLSEPDRLERRPPRPAAEPGWSGA